MTAADPRDHVCFEVAGARVHGDPHMPAEAREAIEQLVGAATQYEEKRRAALTEDERAAEDARREHGRRRLAAIRRRVLATTERPRAMRLHLHRWTRWRPLDDVAWYERWQQRQCRRCPKRQQKRLDP